MSESEVDNSLEDKFGRFILSLTKREDPDLAKIKENLQLELPQGVTIDSIKDWIPRAIESLRKDNPEEEARKSGREGKIFRAPVNYAMIDSNMQDRQIDIGERIHTEIEKHGRQTPTEIVKHLGAIQPEMITMTYIMMLNDNYLRWFTEEDGAKTLELVEISPEEQLQLKQKALEDKNKKKEKEKEKKKRGRKSKKSILEKIKVVDPSPVSSKIKVQNVQFIESPLDKEEETINDINKLIRDSPNWSRNWRKNQ